MFAWIASLFVVLLQGHQARITPINHAPSSGFGTIHSMDTTSPGTEPKTDGSSY
jgi:hypothetical protein